MANQIIEILAIIIEILGICVKIEPIINKCMLKVLDF